MGAIRKWLHRGGGKGHGPDSTDSPDSRVSKPFAPQASTMVESNSGKGPVRGKAKLYLVRTPEPEAPRQSGRDEVVSAMGEWAKGFTPKLAQMLALPERLYRVTSQDLGEDQYYGDEERNAFSDTPGKDSLYVGASGKTILGVGMPDVSRLVYSVGLTDSTSQTYFVLVDPARKLVIIEKLLYLGEGTWEGVERALEAALKAKAEADSRREKYNVVVCQDGSCWLDSPERTERMSRLFQAEE